MFKDLWDTVSLLWSWRWPAADGAVTAVDIDTLRRGSGRESLRLAVAYKFSIGADGPYTGETFWKPIFSGSVLEAKDKIRIGQRVMVRYRPGDPSVSTLDRRVWKDL